MAHLWARWLRNPCRLGGTLRFRAGAKSEVAHLWASGPLNPCRLGDPLRFKRGPNQKWPTCGQGGLTPTASGVPSASERGAESEVAHLWARWLLKWPRGSPPLQSGGQNQKWPLAGKGLRNPSASGGGKNQKWPCWGPPPSGGAESEVAHLWARWLTPAASGVPSASERGAESEVAHLWARWLLNPAASGIPSALERGAESEVAHLWARWLLNPCRLGGPSASERGAESERPTCGQGAT